MSIAIFWMPATVLAAAFQTARNAMQHQLTEALGTLGATQVRFLYGFPFALLFLALIAATEGRPPPEPHGVFLAYTLSGALTQFFATALMLAAMRARTFALTIAYTKTEAMQVALFGFIVLGDPLSWAGAAAIAVASCGVIMISLRPGQAASLASLRPAVLGISSGAFFALSAVSYRGAILTLETGSFVLRASTALTWGLALQTLILAVWLGLLHREALLGSLRVWRASLFAGFMGAVASQFWFIGFALTSAANVRALGLVEVLFAQVVSRRIFTQKPAPHELAGTILLVLGVGSLLLVAQPAG